MKVKRNLIFGIIGSALFMIGDWLWTATGPNQVSETAGLMLSTSYLDMPLWRFAASIMCGVIGTVFYFFGIREMINIIKRYAVSEKDRKYVKLFCIAAFTAIAGCIYVHACCLDLSIVFKSVFDVYGDTKAAASIAHKLLYCNIVPVIAFYVFCDLFYTIALIPLIWKRVLPLRKIAILCNPLFAAFIGNIFTIMPWPFYILNSASESFGHLLIMMLGLIIISREKGQNESKELVK